MEFTEELLEGITQLVTLRIKPEDIDSNNNILFEVHNAGTGETKYACKRS